MLYINLRRNWRKINDGFVIKLPTAPADETKPISVVKTKWRIRVFVKENCVTRHKKSKVLVFIILRKIASVQTISWFPQFFSIHHYCPIIYSLFNYCICPVIYSLVFEVDTFIPPPPPPRKWKSVLLMDNIRLLIWVQILSTPQWKNELIIENFDFQLEFRF